MCTVRPIAWAAAMCACLYTAVPATAATPSLADLLGGGTVQVDGLTFSNFKPLLAPVFPSDDVLLDAILYHPSSLSSMPLIDPSGGGVFSHAFGNAMPAAAGSIAVLPLAGNPADPGLRFDGPSTWSVNAGNIASLQVTGFFYDVTRNPSSGPLLSADLRQAVAGAVTVGPDSFPSDGLPDIALGGALQFVFDSSGQLIDGNATGDLFARFDIPGVLHPSPLHLSQLSSGFTFPAQDTVRVYNLIAVGASSGGEYTLGALDERYDPPMAPHSNNLGPWLPATFAVVPEPASLLLCAIGLGGLRLRCRRQA